MRAVIEPQIRIASDGAETNSGNEVEEPQQFCRFVPRIADQPFVRALARQHDFLSAAVDSARELKQSRAGRVDDRRFGGGDEFWISRERIFITEILDNR